jgi:transposase
MPRPYSQDIRERVVARIEAGSSRHEAAEHFDICASTAVKWMQRVDETGACAAKPSGGSVSPMEAHAEELLAILAERPDMTLDEMVVEIRRRKLPGSRTALWRFLDRRGITFKKRH